MEQFSESFYISVLSIMVGMIGLCVKYCLKSKCNDVSVCCGMIQISRDVNAEIETEERELELQSRGSIINKQESKEFEV
jgi:hypothetical protein